MPKQAKPSRNSPRRTKTSPLPLRERLVTYARASIRPILIGGSLGLGGLALFFLWIDQGVAKRLQNIHASSIPIIYSAPLDLSGLLSRSALQGKDGEALIKSILTERRYIETSGNVTAPGEFALRNRRLDLFTREFRLPSGDDVPSQKTSLSLETRASKGSLDQNGRAVLLEPQPVSYLGSNEVRASTFVPLAEIPLIAQQAVTGIEDERFYEHHGIDLIGIGRAALKNLLAFRLIEGGSTLTQQLAKNLFLSPKRTLSRKLMEIPTALSLERHLSKERLLELYLNEVYLGQEGSVALHGMPEAGNFFFGKKIQDLSVDEVATLAGIIKAPSYFSPRRHPDRAVQRRNVVLAKMRELGAISEGEYAAAIKKPMKVITAHGFDRVAPYFVSALEPELGQAIDLEAARTSGLSIYTGLDLGMQRCAEKALADGLMKLERANPRFAKHGKRVEGALVAIEPYSGLVKAWVGGRDFGESQFNRVNQATRQIGSTVKPFLYLTALDGTLNTYKVATAVSILEDKPMSIEMRKQASWVPENYDHNFRGDVTLRYALENSLNMPAIYVAQRVGISALQRTLSAFEIAPTIPAVPAIALGAVDTNLLRLTASFGALANSGVYVQPRLYISTVDRDGDRLAVADIRETRVADENAVFVLTNILQGVVERGTAKVIRTRGFTREAAGKTGTSDKTRDAWFVGFTPNLVAGVWIGMDDNSPLGVTGGGSSAPIWAEFMKCSSTFFPNVDFIAPRGVSVVDIDRESGKLATEECPPDQRVAEVFVTGTEPTQWCPLHGSFAASPAEHEARLPDEIPPHRNEYRRRGFWESIFGD